MAKNFVTGAAGFLGSQIVDKLYAMGGRDIVAFAILGCDSLQRVTGIQNTVLYKVSVLS